MKVKILYFIVLILVSMPVLGNELLEVKQDYFGFIGDQVDYLVDEERQHNLQEVIAIHEKGGFQASENEIIIFSSPVPEYWISFELQSYLNEDCWLKINNSNLNEIDFYKVDQHQNIVEEFHTGSLFPRNSRAYESNMFWFPLVAGQDQSRYRIFLKLKASLTMEAPMEVGTMVELTRSEKRSDFMAIFFIGALLIMFIYNLFLFLFTKDSIYAYYSFYIVSITFGTTFLNNFPILEDFIGVSLTYNYTACWLWTNLVGIGLFAIQYLKIERRFPKIYRVLWAEMILILAYSVLNIFIGVEHLSLSYQIVVVIFYATCLFTAYYTLAKTKDGQPLLYSIGWTIMMLGGIIYLLVINGALPYTTITRNMMYFGVMSEILIFSIALARRLNSLKAGQEKLNIALQETNQNLEQNNESLDSFNYHVSHDLKTVLNNSNALSRMIEKYNEKRDHQKVNEIVSKLKEVTENGAETVQSFLSLGRIDSIIQNDTAQKVEVAKEIRSIIIRNNLDDQINVEIVKDEIGTITIHQKALESIFLNLLTNSIKYSDREPRVQIQLLKKHGANIFDYVDNGQGIDLDKYGAKLFEPFQRPDSSAGKEGTGVGLYLIKRIVDGYGGDISVDSKLGEGTTFTLKLPIV